MKDFFTDLSRKLVPFVFWMAVWYGLYRLVDKELLLVSPFQVVQTLWKMGAGLEFWQTCFLSLSRIMAGFFLGLLAGVVTACFCFLSPAINRLLNPLGVIVKSTPVASFIILALVYLKTWQIPVFTSFLMVWPPIWASVYEGIQNTDKKLLEMGQVFKLSKAKIIRFIYIPSLMGYFMAAFTTSIGLSWKAGVAAEILARPRPSIGAMLNDSKIYLDTAGMFSWTIVIILLSLLIEAIFVKIMKYFTQKVLHENTKSIKDI